MKVCVTGACGFIGRHVCDALEHAGHEVIGLDTIRGMIGAQGIVADITQPLAPIPNLDAVIHLAAVANPRECDSNPTRAFDVNVNGTHQVLKMAWESGARKVVFSSSAHVYGISPRYLPTDESHPLWLQNNYTLTKILGEQLCQLYYQNHGLSYTVLRLYNAYGPGQIPGYFIPDMIEKARQGQIVLDSGNTTKDFVYIDDVTRAFVRALETPFVGPINIGTGKQTELTDIAEHIAGTTGATSLHTRQPAATRMQADIGRAQRVLGWKPMVNIWEGLDAVLNEAKVQSVSA